VRKRVTPQKLASILRMWDEGKDVPEIAAWVGLPTDTVWAALKKEAGKLTKSRRGS
jgi:hypothetical protein